MEEEKRKESRDWAIGGCQRRKGWENGAENAHRPAHHKFLLIPQELTNLNMVSHTVPNMKIVYLVWFGVVIVKTHSHTSTHHTSHLCQHNTWYIPSVVLFETCLSPMPFLAVSLPGKFCF